MSNKTLTNEQKAKCFANNVLNKILTIIEQHNEKVDSLNDDIMRSNKRYKTIKAKSDP